MNFQIKALAAGAALVRFQGHYENTGASVLATSQSDTQTLVATNLFGTSLPSNGTTLVVDMHGIVTVGANATTLEIDVVDNAITDTIKAGAFLEVFPVA
jgi:hypothetical protein